MPKNQNVKNAGLTGVLRWKARAQPEVVNFFFHHQQQALVGGERRVRVYVSMYICMDACGE